MSFRGEAFGKKGKKLIFAAAAFFLFSCGIEEYYFLPQVPDTVVLTVDNAAFTIDPNLLNDYHYAVGYRLFYRIYLSGADINPPEQQVYNLINPSLSSNYNTLRNFTDPSTSSIVSTNTFSNLRFFELDNPQIRTSGGNISIQFPAAGLLDNPSLTVNEVRTPLLRSNRLTRPLPENNFYLVNTPELNSNANATQDINADVAPGQNLGHAYIAIYIAAIGTHPQNQSRIISSKPTFIGVFKLPNSGV